MRTQSRTQTDSATWAADSTIRTDLENIGLITKLTFIAEVTPSATLAGANQVDGGFRLVQNMSIKGGGFTYFTLPAEDEASGGILWHYLSQMKGSGYGHADGNVSAPKSAYTSIVFPWHIGTRPFGPHGYNPFDVSAFIPAVAESQLSAEWRTSGADVMDDSVTVSAAVGRFVIDRVVCTAQELMDFRRLQGAPEPPAGATGMVPNWLATHHPLDATTTSVEGDTVDLPTGAWLYAMYALVHDATGTRAIRALDEVSEYAILSPRSGNEDLINRNIEYDHQRRLLGSFLTANSGGANSVDADTSTDFDAHYPGGIFMAELAKHHPKPNLFNMTYGLDLRVSPTNALRLGLLIDNRASGDEVAIAWERFQAYDGPVQ